MNSGQKRVSATRAIPVAPSIIMSLKRIWCRSSAAASLVLSRVSSCRATLNFTAVSFLPPPGISTTTDHHYLNTSHLHYHHYHGTNHYPYRHNSRCIHHLCIHLHNISRSIFCATGGCCSVWNVLVSGQKPPLSTDIGNGRAFSYSSGGWEDERRVRTKKPCRMVWKGREKWGYRGSKTQVLIRVCSLSR